MKKRIMKRTSSVLLGVIPVLSIIVMFFTVIFFTESLFASHASALELTCANVKQKVTEAVKKYEAQGDASLPLFKDPKAGFLFGEKIKAKGGQETYTGFIFIIDINHVMLMHANNPRLEGIDFTGKKDKKGDLFVENYIIKAKKAHHAGGQGAWVQYFWPKKKGGKPHKKSSYVQLAVHKDKTVVIGAGIFDVSKEECNNETK
ncbi:cache domain-containing protein [Desulfobacterales bacterium HSG17]|nr:cache domain-containing protein [Desulfobacterales bacterium HSG17]